MWRVGGGGGDAVRREEEGVGVDITTRREIISPVTCFLDKETSSLENLNDLICNHQQQEYKV